VWLIDPVTGDSLLYLGGGKTRHEANCGRSKKCKHHLAVMWRTGTSGHLPSCIARYDDEEARCTCSAVETTPK
jgi:hypothetical protein